MLSGCDPTTNNAPATADQSGIHAPPTTAPARICDDPSLRGPATAPTGSRVIDVGDDVGAEARHAPEGGTTFWLAPGTHRLSNTRYSSVIPRDGQVFVGAPGAVLDGGRVNLYAFTGSATDVTIRHLTIQNFGTRTDNNSEGVVNHDSADGWLVEHNTVRRNGGAGVFMGSGSFVQHDCLADNGQHGFSAFSPQGPEDLVLRHNEITGNNTADWESRIPGCGCTGGGKFWATSGAVIESNWIHDNHGPGLWADNNNTGFACADPDKIARDPRYDDCRWKTQHVRVKRNVFELDPERIGDECTPRFGCGFTGVFSNWGSYPPWSPFHGTVVEEQITHDQDNLWAENTYRGTWRFMVLEAGNKVSWDEWRGAPYGQDSGSTFE